MASERTKVLTENVVVRMSPALRVALEESAKTGERTLSQEIRRACVRYLATARPALAVPRDEEATDGP